MRRRRRQLARVRSEPSAAESANSEWGVHGDETCMKPGNAREGLRFLIRVCRIVRSSMVVHVHSVLRLLDSSMRHVKLHYCCGVCT